jgi:hypothetical protein
MPNEQLSLTLKRHRDDLKAAKLGLRKKYRDASRQVTSKKIKKGISTLAESWIAGLSQRREVINNVSEDFLADFAVRFQRLLRFTEQATMRRRYDAEIKALLAKYTTEVIVPILQGRNDRRAVAASTPATETKSAEPGESFRATAFVGHSFDSADKIVVSTVTEVLEAVGVRVETGTKPKADRISEKVKKLIEAQYLFIGIFTRREKLSGRQAWNTSAWVIDEKAFAFARNRKLILLKEEGVDSIGGIQGDYEYIEFSRECLQQAAVSLLQVFDVKVSGLSP